MAKLTNIVPSEQIEELKKYLTVVYDFEKIMHNKKIEDLCKEIPEAENIEIFIKTLPKHFSEQIDEFKKEVDSVITELTNEIVHFAYKMKSMNNTMNNRREDYKLNADRYHSELDDLKTKYKKLEDENKYLREIVELRKQVQELKEATIEKVEPVAPVEEIKNGGNSRHFLSLNGAFTLGMSNPSQNNKKNSDNAKNFIGE